MEKLSCVVLVLHLHSAAAKFSSNEGLLVEDILVPYKNYHGPRHRHRVVRECQPAKYNNVTFELYKSHSSSDITLPIYEHLMFSQSVGDYSWNQHNVNGNVIKVSNPFKTFTVVEPGGTGGCMNHTKSTVVNTALARSCMVASNAGFFNTSSHACIGNLVVDGVQLLNNGGIQNAHFGIRKDGSLFTGYVAETLDLSDEFKVLVGGVLWLVRDGVNYVTEALKAECGDVQETGSLEYFAQVTSARTAVGHDADGRVVMVQVDGRTRDRGLDLYEFADLLIVMGVVNAINTDGGGSATLVINNTVVNHPSDAWVVNNLHYTYARKVSTVLCVHDLPCSYNHCSGHGRCIHGICHCDGNWIGPDCESIQCGALNCSINGACTERGCMCKPGWVGPDCTSVCPDGRYGAQCAHTCRCANGAECNHVDGSCACIAGYAGLLCDQECPYGMYGENCRQICYCEDSCYCHHITGACNMSRQFTPFWLASKCLAEQYIFKKHLVPDQTDQYTLWLITTVAIAVIATASIIINILLACMYFLRNNSSRKRRFGRKSRKTYTAQSVFQRSVFISSYSSNDEGNSEQSVEINSTEFFNNASQKSKHSGETFKNSTDVFGTNSDTGKTSQKSSTFPVVTFKTNENVSGQSSDLSQGS